MKRPDYRVPMDKMLRVWLVFAAACVFAALTMLTAAVFFRKTHEPSITSVPADAPFTGRGSWAGHVIDAKCADGSKPVAYIPGRRPEDDTWLCKTSKVRP